MDLTEKERLILWNQYSILEALYPEQAEHYERCKTIVADGYKSHYGSLCEHIDEHELSEEEAHEVLEILSMFEALKDSAPNAEKVKENIIESWVARFPGFDGNSEWDYLGYLEFLVKQKRYAHIADSQRLNSRVPLLGRYREMLTIWEQLNRPSVLSAEQIRQLFSWYKRPE